MGKDFKYKGYHIVFTGSHYQVRKCVRSVASDWDWDYADEGEEPPMVNHWTIFGSYLTKEEAIELVDDMLHAEKCARPIYRNMGGNLDCALINETIKGNIKKEDLCSIFFGTKPPNKKA